MPLPLKHRQTDPDEGHEQYVIEPLWTQFRPVSATTQYLLSWYAAETLPPDEEAKSADDVCRAYCVPTPFPKDITLQQRIAMDVASNYEPLWHEGTGVNEDEAFYRSYLISIDEATSKLSGTAMGEIMADVVRRGWECIERRMAQEKATAGTADV